MNPHGDSSSNDRNDKFDAFDVYKDEFVRISLHENDIESSSIRIYDMMNEILSNEYSNSSFLRFLSKSGMLTKTTLAVSESTLMLYPLISNDKCVGLTVLIVSKMCNKSDIYRQCSIAGLQYIS